ncbi:MAG: hypothetical protein WCG66_00865 [bacterium]
MNGYALRKTNRRAPWLEATAWVLLVLACPGLWAQELSIPAGGTFDPFLLALKPAVQMSPLPTWMDGPVSIKPELARVEVPIAPGWKESSVDSLAVTVIFEDSGEGGPALEWQHHGEVSSVCSGLGVVGSAVGLNSRTVLLPDMLTRDGGVLVISCAKHFDSLLSLAVRPARRDETAVLGDRRSAALIDGAFQAFDEREVSASRTVPLTGDVRAGTIVEAELSAAVESLEQPIEFEVPVEGHVEGAMLHLEALGLDPEAVLEVSINSQQSRHVAFAPFALDDPSLVTDWNGRLVLAGWRKGSLFLPAGQFKQGENQIVITLKRAGGETGRAVSLRNTSLHLRFTPSAFEARPDPHRRANPPEGNPNRDAPAVDFQSLDPILPPVDEIR